MSFKIATLRKQLRLRHQEKRLIEASHASIAFLFRQLREPLPPIKVRLDPAIAHAFDAVIQRDGRGFEVLLSNQNPADTAVQGPERLRSFLYWLLRSDKEVEEISVTLSDGDRSSSALFSPSTFLADVVALPDPIFFSSNGYAAERTIGLNHAVPWRERTSTLAWRGGMNSLQSFDPDIAMSKPQFASQRLLACMLLRNTPASDVKFAVAQQPETGPDVYQRLGVTGTWITPQSWLGRKYALDIDGYSNAWSNLFTRLLFGCCVMKVDSRFGFRQWYYDRLSPWEHYVPVAADLSDLADRFDWMRGHDAECRDIAQRGRRLALTLTLNGVTPEVKGLIEANWQRQR